MNELQLGLIALGGVAVAGVFTYNKWQEHRHRKLAEQVLQRDHDDVLLAAERAEATRSAPALSDEDREPPFVDDPVLPDSGLGADERMEPVLHSGDAPTAFAGETVFVAESPMSADSDEADTEMAGETVEEIAPFSPPAAPATPMRSPAPGGDGLSDGIASPAIDYVASFELVEPVSGDQILRSQRELLARVTKPIGWAGFSDRSGQWERVSEEGDYRRLRVGLLLADRRGPLGEADLLTFYGAMQNLADELMAVADMPPRESALDAAIALDQFCANVDIQVGINLVSKGQPFLGTKIRALAEAAGMVLDSSGRFVRCDDDGHVLYTLANQESLGFSAESMKTMSTHGLVFILDVPCVSHGDRVFAQMLDLARRMADALNGALVDDNRRPLTEAMLDPFRRQIGQYQAQLAAKGLPAGSALTLRLFS